MSEAMVTGRMSAAKKKAGNKILSSIGVNASQAINQLYDYIIENKQLPFPELKEHKINPKKWKEAEEFVASIPVYNRFSTMTDEEIRQERLAYISGR